MTKTIELSNVRRGERFTLDGVEFVKLDEIYMASFVVTADALPDGCPFESAAAEREDHNNFSGSYIEKVLNRWLRNHTTAFMAALKHFIHLKTMDGMTDYGAPLVAARLLTIDEYREYRRFIPLASRPFWLATGSSPGSGASYAYSVFTDGSVLSHSVYSAYFAPRPALYLKYPILVSVKCDEGERMLSDYNDKELVWEMLERQEGSK